MSAEHAVRVAPAPALPDPAVLAALRRELAPYFASRRVPVDDQGRPVPYLQMNIGGVVE